MTLAERVQYLRGLTDLTRRGLSVLAGLDPKIVRLIEADAKPELSWESLRKLARTLDVSMDWLADGTGNPPSAVRVRAAVDRARAAQDAA